MNPGGSTISDVVPRSTAMASLRRALQMATLFLAASCAAHAQPAGIDPAALQILKASTDFLARQQRFSVDTRMSLEAVLFSGQTIEFNVTSRESVQRPDKLRADREGDLTQTFFYDGAT
jgi:hypothetical protein